MATPEALPLWVIFVISKSCRLRAVLRLLNLRKAPPAIRSTTSARSEPIRIPFLLLVSAATPPELAEATADAPVAAGGTEPEEPAWGTRPEPAEGEESPGSATGTREELVSRWSRLRSARMS